MNISLDDSDTTTTPAPDIEGGNGSEKNPQTKEPDNNPKSHSRMLYAENEKTKKENDSRLIRNNDESNSLNIFTFLIALFMGKLNDDTIDEVSNALSLGDDFKQTVEAVKSGEMSPISAAAYTYSSLDTENINWENAQSVINNDTYQSFIEHLKLREGYKNEVYPDNGQLAVGIGHLIKPSDNLRLGDVISDEQVMAFLEQDSIAAYNRALLQAKEVGINDKGFIAGLASVNFQLGLDWNKEHKQTWALMKQGRFEEATIEVADSTWNSQTRIRVEDFQKILQRAAQIHAGTIEAALPENTNTASLRLSNQILQVSRTDNAYGGYCAKGVANIFKDLGVSVTRGDAHTWVDSLPQNGWIKLKNIDPENAPIGSAIVYDRNQDYSGKSGGAEYGHIEIASIDENGQRLYVSDKARSNWGGTVPQNFAGVFVHPDIHGDIIASLSESTKQKTGLSNTFSNSGTTVIADAKQPDPLTKAFGNGNGVDQIALASEIEAQVPTKAQPNTTTPPLSVG